MAATKLIPLHANRGKTASQSIKDRMDYAQNPEKTEGEYVSSYECNPKTAWAEFALSRREYLQTKDQIRERDVIAYQIRQSFKPGEIDPETANRLGYELAMRFTKGKHAFTVSTHTDRAHIHNHVIFNAVDLTGTRKFKNFFLSTYALHRFSDLICAENNLSIIEEKPKREWQHRTSYKKVLSNRDVLRADIDEILAGKPKTYDDLLAELEQKGYEIKRGKHTAVKSKAMGNFVRFRSLGDGYTEQELIIAITSGKHEEVPVKDDGQEFTLMKNLEKILREKGPGGYEKWAQGFNNKQAAHMLIFLQENGIKSEEQLAELADKSAEHFHELASEIKACEARLSEITELKKTIVNYSKTRSTYEAYRKAGYSKKFYEEHRAEITIHQAAKKKFDALGTKKIPRVKELSAEYDEVLAKKKSTYVEYREARSRMQKYSIAKKNVDLLLEKESVPARNAQPSHEV